MQRQALALASAVLLGAAGCPRSPGTLTPPTITTPTKKTNDNTPVLAGTSTPNATVEVWIGSTSIGTTTADGGGNWTIHNLTQTLEDWTYTVMARVKNGTQYSDSSNTITITVDTVAPDAPTNVSANRVIIRWTASRALDLMGYNVYRRRQGGMTWTKLNTLAVRKDQSQYCDLTAVDGTTYEYKVTAVDDALNEKH